jgi:chitin disaccharide deacetylase
VLFVNADDLGWTRETTDRILACYRERRIHAASAMTFMKDSERAAELSRETCVPVGLHLNLTHDFTGYTVNPTLRDDHRRVAAYLKASKINQILYNPFLRKAVDYVFQAQWDEFHRLYGQEPTRLDGHQHMHLCINMLVSTRLHERLKIRRNFTFGAGEKNPINRLYRYLIDIWLSGRFEIADYFFSINPIEEGRLNRLISLSKGRNVEIMVHPGVDSEYRYLMSDNWLRLLSSWESMPAIVTN